MKDTSVKMCAAFFIGALLHVNAAHAGGSAGNFASEVTQMANNVQLVQQYEEMVEQTAKQANMVQQQINTYNNLKRNTKKLTNLEWGTASTHLMQLRDVVNRLQGIGYSLGSINDVFEQQYPGYSNISISQRPDHERFSETYRRWNRTTTDTVHSSIQAAGMQEQQFDSENATMKNLEDMGRTADGQMQALEVGNMISAQAVRQSQKLRQIVASNVRMQGAYMAQETQKDARRQEVRDSYNQVEKYSTNVGDEDKARLPTR